MSSLLTHFQQRQPDMLDLLAQMVAIESPTTEPSAVNAMGDFMQGLLRDLGAGIEIDPQTERGDHVIGRFGDANGREPILMIGHMDTVWKLGTLKDRPFTLDGERAFGPGTVDMKAGLVIMVFAMRAIKELGLDLGRPLSVIFNSDEELKSWYSRELIFAEAKKSAYSLVFEGSQDLARFTNQRKASGRYWVEAHGVASHAGAAIDKGINAIEELSHQIQSLQAMTDLEIGTTVNVGVITGGDRPNIVPDRAKIGMSVRAASLSEIERIDGAIKALQPKLPGAKLEIEGFFHRGVFAPVEGSEALFDALTQAARAAGVEAELGFAGGASDANLTASVGTPSLDGLGAVGDGAHSIDEHILVDSLATRAAIATDLIVRLGRLDA